MGLLAGSPQPRSSWLSPGATAPSPRVPLCSPATHSRTGSSSTLPTAGWGRTILVLLTRGRRRLGSEHVPGPCGDPYSAALPDPRHHALAWGEGLRVTPGRRGAVGPAPGAGGGPGERVCPRRGRESLRLGPHVSSFWRAARCIWGEAGLGGIKASCHALALRPGEGWALRSPNPKSGGSGSARTDKVWQMRQDVIGLHAPASGNGCILSPTRGTLRGKLRHRKSVGAL